MKNKWILGLMLSLLFTACNLENEDEQRAQQFRQELAQADYKVDVSEMKWSQQADSIFLKFKIMNKNEKEFWGEIKPMETHFVNERIDVKQIKILKRGNKENIPDNILVSLLIDKSIPAEDMTKVQDAVKHFVNTLPDNTAYISFFDNTLSQTYPITANTFDTFEDKFKVTNDSNKIIFGATLNKFRELTGAKISSSDTNMLAKIQSDTIKKYLILLTDGKYTATGAEADNITRFSDVIQALDGDELNKNHIEVHAIRYGEENAAVDNQLSFICKDLRKENVQGGFYTESPDSVLSKFVDNISPDYEFVLQNSAGRIYSGENRDFMIQINKDGKKALGIKNYTIGTPTNPITTGNNSLFQQIALGIFWGLVILFISYFIIQVVIPYLITKFSNFEKKYVKEYKPNDDEIIRCAICMEDFIEGEKVVEKCQHITHWHCWRENGYKCSEYGQNCTEGKQYYFDKDKPFSAANSPYYIKWVLYGMIGGLFSWIIYQILVSLNPLLFQSFTNWLLQIFYPGDLQKLEADVLIGFLTKIGPLLLIGILLGFTLTFLFAYINEYRQKKFAVIMSIFFRSIIGSCLGFISFVIGSIIIIACKATGIDIWIDWIPWLLFGGSLGLCLSVKTDIALKHALLGGIISGLISFVLLFLSRWFGSYATLLSFTLYSAGLGLSIVTIHHAAQKYFLKYKGEKEGEIAIHKWMSVIGGSNDVTIGKSTQCIIQMNWDNNPNIQDIQAKLYVDKKMGVPFLKVLGENVLYNNSPAKKGDEFQLKNGVHFKIGDTEFQYVEKG
jgi:hypothetical protein